MKRIFVGLVLCALLIVSPVSAEEKSCNELIDESEQLWMETRYDESDKKLDTVMEMCPDMADAYWRKARNDFDRIESIPRDKKPDKDILIQRYYAIEALADKCIELDENNGSCWLWKGVGIGRRGTTQGVLRSLFLADDVEGAWLKALSLKPTYHSADNRDNALADAYYALGMFYRLVPEWLCYFPFNLLIGACGDKEKSIEYEREAVALSPNRIQFHRALGVSLLCHGQTYDKPEEIAEGKKILKDLQSMLEVRPYDYIDKEHARMLLADPSLACGYQRDAQHEVSKEAYDKENQEPK
jgi:tetratricopeptide (TPR) repeat protein